jgi:predicted SAM-dependent methyltransferase
MLSELVKIPLRHARASLSEMRSEVRQLGAAGRLRGVDRLQLGAGNHPLPGWANLDLSGDSVIWDLTKPIPAAPGSIRFVYSEHFIEHVSRDDAQRILANCFAAMAPGAAIRISTPDLAKVIEDYQSGTLVAMPWGEWFPSSLCRMVNEALHLWGHQFVYDEAELSSALRDAGFRRVRRAKWRESDVAELSGLETRPDMGDLILEAVK